MTKTKKSDAQTTETVTGSGPAQRPGMSNSRKTPMLWAAGVVTIALGFVLLTAGSATPAAALLVAGYCGLVPLAILSGQKR